MVRLKHRYLLVNILYPEPHPGRGMTSNDTVPYTVQLRQPTTDAMDGKLFIKIIRQGVSDLFGDYGAGMVSGSLQIKYFSSATSTAIIRVSRDHYRMVWAALTFITRLPRPVDQACVMQVVRVSGTIKKAEEEAIRRARLSIKQAQMASGQSNGNTNALTSTLSDLRRPTALSVDHVMEVEDPDEYDDEDEEDDDD